MNGTYRIPLPPDVEPGEYKPVKALLRAFDPGATISVTRIEGKLSIHGLNGCNGSYGTIAEGPFKGCQAEHYAEIKATGGTAKRRAAHTKWHAPGPMKAERAAKEAEKERPNAIRRGLLPIHHSYNFSRESWYANGGRQESDERKTGRMIAKAIARGETTVHFPETGGTFPITTLLAEAKKRREYRQDTDAGLQPFSVGLPERLSAYRDYLYWRECESLAGQREHFKPGLSDDTRTSDDEIDTARTKEPETPPIQPQVVDRTPTVGARETPKPAGWWFQDWKGRSYWVPRKTEVEA